MDATHPYAAAVTENIRRICKKISCPLLRILREDTRAAFHDMAVSHDIWQKTPEDIIFMDSVEDAAVFLADTQGKILITTGSKELEKYTIIENYQNRCIARVLPILSVMEKCAGLGFAGKNLIAMQGPFSEEMNYQMLKQADCRYLVTKDSGKEGGYEEKCEAALRAGVKLVVVKRPKEAAWETAIDSHVPDAFQAMSLSEAIDYLSARYGLMTKRTVYLIGAGPGAAEPFHRRGDKMPAGIGLCDRCAAHPAKLWADCAETSVLRLQGGGCSSIFKSTQ